MATKDPGVVCLRRLTAQPPSATFKAMLIINITRPQLVAAVNAALDLTYGLSPAEEQLLIEFAREAPACMRGTFKGPDCQCPASSVGLLNVNVLSPAMTFALNFDRVTEVLKPLAVSDDINFWSGHKLVVDD